MAPDARIRLAFVAIAVGGLVMITVWIPFTLTHGPTSYNEGRVLGGMDMHGWGLLLGVVPNLVVVAGLLLARNGLVAGRCATAALGVVIAALVGSTLLDLAFRALGPPFSILLLAPATLALAVLARDFGQRVSWALLATAYVVAFALLLVPEATSDGFGGYRIYGLVAHVAVGLGWLTLACRMRISRRNGLISPERAHT